MIVPGFVEKLVPDDRRLGRLPIRIALQLGPRRRFEDRRQRCPALRQDPIFRVEPVIIEFPIRVAGGDVQDLVVGHALAGHGEQREGRVHRYKGHVVRKNIAETLSSSLHPNAGADIWEDLFNLAAENRIAGESEMVPYWVYPQGSAKIERHVPLLPFSRDASELPRLKNSLAAYRLAFGQPRQEDLVEFLRRNHSESEIESLVQKFQIDLRPPSNHQIS